MVALLVLAVAVSMITALSVTSIVAARRADNQLLADQAWYYLTGAEELAAEMIKQRLQDMGEAAAENPELGLQRLDIRGQFETDDGWIAYEVVDLQGRFNLNALRADLNAGGPLGLDEESGEEQPPDQPPSLFPPAGTDGSTAQPPVAHQQFVRLLRALQDPPMDEADAIAIRDALIDWMDVDVLETGFGGAELAYYEQQPVPYRPADGPLRDVSELLLIKGITPELYRALRDLVSVWPQEAAAINIATVSPGLIRALYQEQGGEPMDAEMAQTLFAAIQEQEITTVEDFQARPEWGPAGPAGDFDTRSTVFLVSLQTEVGRLRQGMESVVLIRDNKAKILARSLTML